MALLARCRASLAALGCVVAGGLTLLAACASAPSGGRVGFDIADKPYRCQKDGTRCETFDVPPEPAMAPMLEPTRPGGYVGTAGTVFEKGIYVYAELVRAGGRRAVLELDLQAKQNGTTRALYLEQDATGRVTFRSTEARGVVELTGPSCRCVGGRFELIFTDKRRGEQRRVGRGVFSATGRGHCLGARRFAVQYAKGVSVVALGCPQPSGSAPRRTPPSRSGGGGTTYDPTWSVDSGGCGASEPEPSSDTGGCGGDDDWGGSSSSSSSSSSDDSGGGCEGDNSSGSSGCDGDGSSDRSSDSSGGCDGDGDSSSSSSGCESDANAAVNRSCKRARAKAHACRRRPARRRSRLPLGVTWPCILVGLLITHARRRRRRRSRAPRISARS